MKLSAAVGTRFKPGGQVIETFGAELLRPSDGMAGNRDEASRALARLLMVYPEPEGLRTLHELLGPVSERRDREHYEEGLRKAGAPGVTPCPPGLVPGAGSLIGQVNNNNEALPAF